MDLKQSAIIKLWSFLPVDLDAKRELKKEKHQAGSNQTDDVHLRETAAWLCRAQDSSPDGGVSRAYKASLYKGHGPHGWQPSYPETTGYIIPTMIALSKTLNDSSYLERAIRMADWEISIQMPSGAVMGSVVTAPPSPAVFNTGQVIFGWVAAFNETRDKKYLDSASRAGDYLVSIQDNNGAFSSGDSNFALKGATTYNARVAWALIELGITAKNEKYINAGKKNIEHALSKQQPNGWFRDNCLNDPVNPLLHTIVYATRGILESGLALNEDRYVQPAIKTLDALCLCQRPDGGIPGRLDSEWRSSADWDCVTGDAQAAIAWLRAFNVTSNERYKEAARRAIDFVKGTQNLEHSNPGICGGVKGSYPFDGPYGRFEMLNWAAKFFCDALLLVNNSELVLKGIKG